MLFWKPKQDEEELYRCLTISNYKHDVQHSFGANRKDKKAKNNSIVMVETVHEEMEQFEKKQARISSYFQAVQRGSVASHAV